MFNKVSCVVGVLLCLTVVATVYWLKKSRPLSENVILQIIEQSENYEDLVARIQNKVRSKERLGNYISELIVLGENGSKEDSSVNIQKYKYEGTIISGNQEIKAIPQYGCTVYSFSELGLGGYAANRHYVVFDGDKRLIGIVVPRDRGEK